MSGSGQAQAQDQARRHEFFSLALFRLFKLVTMHELSNQAVQRGIQHAEETLRALMAHEQGDMSALFSGDNVFINGQPLRASRATYESLQELGEMLEHINLNEIRIGRRVGAEDLEKMLRFFLQAKKEPLHGAQFVITSQIRLQYIDPSFLLDEEEEELSLDDQVARTFASTVVVMRRALEGVENGQYRLLNTIKRATQSLVMLVEQDATAVLSVLQHRVDSQDLPTLSVQCATLAAVMTRLLTRDMKTLSDVTSAALMLDYGELRMKALLLQEDDPFGDGIAAELTEQERDRAPASEAAALVAMSGLYDRALNRALIAHEALWLTRQQRIGLPYRGRIAPSLEALIVAMARRFLNLVAFDMRTHVEHSPDEALQVLLNQAKMPAELLVLKLLCSALGIYPKGTVVGLSSGWRGVVAANHTSPSSYDRPLVFLVDRPGEGGAPRFADLAQLEPDILRLGAITHIVARPNGALAQAQEMIMNGKLPTPDISEPQPGAGAHPGDISSAGPLPNMLTLTDSNARRQRMKSILDHAEVARRSRHDDDEPDEQLFSTHDS